MAKRILHHLINHYYIKKEKKIIFSSMEECFCTRLKNDTKLETHTKYNKTTSCKIKDSHSNIKTKKT